jgi:hypothetical protein
VTISVVQVSNASGVFPSAVTVGNTVLLVVAEFSAPTVTVTSVELGGSVITGTTQLEFPQTAGGGSPQGVCIVMMPNVQVSGQTTVSYTCSGSVIGTYAIEVAGLGASPTLDQFVTATGATGTISSGSTGSTTAAAEFVFCAAATYNGTTASPTGSSWTATTGLGSNHLSVGYIIQSSSAQTYSWTQVTGGTTGWAVAIVTLKAGGSATVTGVAATSALAAPAGSVSAGATVTGVAATSALVAPAGSVVAGKAVAGVAATTALAAPAGSVTASSAVAGVAATSSLFAPAGTVSGNPEVFPEIALGLTAELQVNSAWTDITGYMDHGPVVIGRGHPDESTTVSPSTLAMTLTNSSGEFTSQNPAGPWYPWLKPNIPLRVSIPAATSYLRLEADQSDRAYVSEVSALDITGSLEARIELRPSDWGGGVLACKWDGGGCWSWTLNGDGTMSLAWYDSSAAFHSVTSTVPLPMLNAQTALRVTLNASTGAVAFYSAASIDGTYAQLGAVVSATGATSVATSATSALAVGWSGNFSPGQLLGAVTGFRLYNGIGGTVVADAQFSAQAAGATAWTDGAGRTWGIAGGAEVSGRDYRGHFEVPEWPQEEPTWEPDGDGEVDVLCAIAGGGLLRRLGQVNTPLASPMRRAYVKLSATAKAAAPAAYWPGEDLAGSTQLASGLGGPAMGVSGPLQLASSTAFACSAALPAVNGAVLAGAVPTISSWTDNVIRFLLAVPSGGEANGTVIAECATTGIVALLQLVYTTASGGSLTLSGYSGIGAQLFTTGAEPFAVNGQLLRVSMNMRQVSGNLLYEIETLAVGAASATVAQATFTGAAVAAVRSVTFNPGGAAGLTTTVLGHCSVQPVWDTLFDTSGALAAWLGEPAGVRFQRLCGEEGIPFRGRGELAASMAMGAQTAETLSQLLQECADADRGVWYEPRQVLGWGYVTRQALYNQPAGVTYDHGQDHLSPWASNPVQDDQALLNDATITATSGSSARAYAAPGQPVSGGRLSNLPPPAGIGVYDSVPTSSVNTARDGDLQQIASWMIHIGTTDQQRFPGISVDLANTAFPYFAQTVAMDLGDRLVIANPPPWLGPDPVSQLCQGLKETLWAYDYEIEVNGVPETPYQVAVAGVSHAATAGSQVNATYTYGAPTMSVATTAGNIWTTNAGDFPFNVMASGMVLTVTNITGSSSPQTFSVTPGVNGVQKNLASGTAVQVYPRPVAAL